MQQILDNYLNLEIMREAFPEVLGGFWVTVQASIAVIIIGLASGLALAICRCMRNPIIDCVITAYVEIFRTLPQLVVLIFLYFGLPYMGLTLSPFFATVFGLSAVLSAFSAEIFWASIVAVPRSELALTPMALSAMAPPTALALAPPVAVAPAVASASISEVSAA